MKAFRWIIPPLLVVLIGVLLIAFVAAGPASACSTVSAPATTSGISVPGPPHITGTANSLAGINLSVYQTIKQYAVDQNHSPRLMASMVFGTGVESTFGLNQSHGPAFGYFSIEQPGVVHTDITVAQAMDPTYATQYMLPHYIDALKNVDPSMWLTPQSYPAALEEVAFKAEKPAERYSASHSAQQMTVVYQTSIKILQAVGVSTDFVNDTSILSTPGQPPTPASECDPYSNTGFVPGTAAQTVIKAAQKYIGFPYVWGGGGTNGPSASTVAHGNFNDVGFDCSGLTQYAYHQAGIELPRLAADQYTSYPAAHRSLGQEQPGDLVFFAETKGGPIVHVEIVVDPSKHVMIGAQNSGTPLGYSDYTKNWPIVGFVHLLPDASSGPSNPGTPGVGMVGPDGFTGGSCVIYVEYILRRHVTGYPALALFPAGADMAAQLGPYGFRVDHTPAVHAVVSFPRTLADSTYGHVAIVSAIYSDGRILVEESNFTNPKNYGTHIVSASIVSMLTYAHTEVGWHDTPTPMW